MTFYACGPTVYNFAHIGNFRAYVFEDLLQRHLEARGYDVWRVMNLTDVDDKIINRANERGETIQQLTDRYIGAMHEDSDALGVLRPTKEPRATEYVQEMLDLIGTLENKGLAYQGGDGEGFEEGGLEGPGKDDRGDNEISGGAEILHGKLIVGDVTFDANGDTSQHIVSIYKFDASGAGGKGDWKFDTQVEFKPQ